MDSHNEYISIINTFNYYDFKLLLWSWIFCLLQCCPVFEKWYKSIILSQIIGDSLGPDNPVGLNTNYERLRLTQLYLGSPLHDLRSNYKGEYVSLRVPKTASRCSRRSNLPWCSFASLAWHPPSFFSKTPLDVFR